MDLTIEVMLSARGATGGAQGASANANWRILAIVAVYPMKTVPVVAMPCTGYVHVTGVPDRSAWAGLGQEEILMKINARLCREWEESGQMVERRLFAGDAPLIPAGARADLLADRQITVTWAQFKAFVLNVKEARALTDEDLDDE